MQRGNHLRGRRSCAVAILAILATIATPVGLAAVDVGATGLPAAPSAAAGTTTVTAPGSGTGQALLSDVQVQSTNGVDSVVFQFTGPNVPHVEVTDVAGPLLAISGEAVPIAGAAVLSVALFPASAVDLGDRCPMAAPPVTPGADQQAIGVAFSCRNPTAGPWPASRTSRAVAASPDPATLLEEAVNELLGGPDPGEQGAGFSSPFTTATHGSLLSATIAADGTAVLDFDPTLVAVLGTPTASIADQILRGLDGTVAQFTAISGAEYRVGGSCTAFFAWLGQACALRTVADLASAGFAPTYAGPPRVAGPTANVTEAVAVSDFEATLAWGIGLRTEVAITVRSDPENFRVIINIPQAPPPMPTTITPVAPVVVSPRFTG